MSTWQSSVAVASTYDDDGSETWHKLSITVIFSQHILNYFYYVHTGGYSGKCELLQTDAVHVHADVLWQNHCQAFSHAFT
jgi:hypothetical protein